VVAFFGYVVSYRVHLNEARRLQYRGSVHVRTERLSLTGVLN
jgi:hypothetical protein